MVCIQDTAGVYLYKSGLPQTLISNPVQDISINEHSQLVLLNNAQISIISLTSLFGECAYTQFQTTSSQTIDILESALVNATLDTNTPITIAYTNPSISLNVLTLFANNASVNATIGIQNGRSNILFSILPSFSCSSLESSEIVAGCAATRVLVYNGCLPYIACNDQGNSVIEYC